MGDGDENVVVLSLATILQSTNVLSNPDASAKVVRIGGRFAVKFGKTVSLLEAQNLSYVAKHSNVPVPKLYGTLSEEASTGARRNFFIMEMVHGQTLEKAWPELNDCEKQETISQLRKVVSDLRAMPPPKNYIGFVEGRACEDGIFWMPEHDPSVSGPFASEDGINEGMLRKMESAVGKSLIFRSPALTCSVDATRSSSRLHTHGDLQMEKTS